MSHSRVSRSSQLHTFSYTARNYVLRASHTQMAIPCWFSPLSRQLSVKLQSCTLVSSTVQYTQQTREEESRALHARGLGLLLARSAQLRSDSKVNLFALHFLGCSLFSPSPPPPALPLVRKKGSRKLWVLEEEDFGASRSWADLMDRIDRFLNVLCNILWGIGWICVDQCKSGRTHLLDVCWGRWRRYWAFGEWISQWSSDLAVKMNE